MSHFLSLCIPFIIVIAICSFLNMHLIFFYLSIYASFVSGFASSNLTQLGGIVVNMLACCAGGPRFDPQVENLKFTTDIIQMKH